MTRGRVIKFPEPFQSYWDHCVKGISDQLQSADALDELRELARLRPRREAQVNRLWAGDVSETVFRDSFSYYAETKFATLGAYCQLRRQQRRDGLLRRLPHGTSFEETLAKLHKQWLSEQASLYPAWGA